jgi:tRNA (guanine37-N1)-methyltransferase
MTFHIITLFPEMFSALNESILKRAREKGLIDIQFHNLRDYATDKHKTVDDTPYGGGKGMVLKVDIMDRAISNLKDVILSPEGDPFGQAKNLDPSTLSQDDTLVRTILLSPKGSCFNQDKAKKLATYDNVVLICGHYEGFDERIRSLVDEEISIGDFVLTGGEIPAMAIVDSVARLVPGVLSENSAENESFMETDEDGKYLLEAPQYTRPEIFKGMKVPEVLLSGNHKEIDNWRKDNQKKAI